MKHLCVARAHRSRASSPLGVASASARARTTRASRAARRCRASRSRSRRRASGSRCRAGSASPGRGCASSGPSRPRRVPAQTSACRFAASTDARPTRLSRNRERAVGRHERAERVTRAGGADRAAAVAQQRADLGLARGPSRCVGTQRSSPTSCATAAAASAPSRRPRPARAQRAPGRHSAAPAASAARSSSRRVSPRGSRQARHVRDQLAEVLLRAEPAGAERRHPAVAVHGVGEQRVGALLASLAPSPPRRR